MEYLRYRFIKNKAQKAQANRRVKKIIGFGQKDIRACVRDKEEML